MHGNGPQVGNILIQDEAAADRDAAADARLLRRADGGLDRVPPRARLRERALEGRVPQGGRDDRDAGGGGRGRPGVPTSRPSRSGRSSRRSRRRSSMESMGWAMVEDAGRGWRKVVASPRPRRDPRGRGRRGAHQPRAHRHRGRRRRGPGRRHGGGRDPRASRRSSTRITRPRCSRRRSQADLFIVLTGVERVSRDFGKPTQRELPEISAVARRGAARGGAVPAREHGSQDRRGDPIHRGGRARGADHARGVARRGPRGRTGTRIREARA